MMRPTQIPTARARNLPVCLWAQAGVVRKKDCRREFQCTGCAFDQALDRAARQNAARRRAGRPDIRKRDRFVHWRDRLRLLPAARQPCLHHMKGQIRFRACTHDYRCADCEFDQYFEDQFTVHAVVRPVQVLEVSGVSLPQGLYLDRGHTWSVPEADGAVRIGLDDFARRLVGCPDRIETPLIGTAVRRGDPLATVIRGKRRAVLRAPVSGIVTDVNSELRENGRPAHADPYGKGWLVRLHAPEMRCEIRQLLIGTEAAAYLHDEIDRLFSEIEAIVPLAADGGHPGEDILGHLPENAWDPMVYAFFAPPDTP